MAQSRGRSVSRASSSLSGSSRASRCPQQEPGGGGPGHVGQLDPRRAVVAGAVGLSADTMSAERGGGLMGRSLRAAATPTLSTHRKPATLTA